MTIDTIESDLVFRYKASPESREIRLVFTLENGITLSESIRVIE